MAKQQPQHKMIAMVFSFFFSFVWLPIYMSKCNGRFYRFGRFENRWMYQKNFKFGSTSIFDGLCRSFHSKQYCWFECFFLFFCNFIFFCEMWNLWAHEHTCNTVIEKKKQAENLFDFLDAHQITTDRLHWNCHRIEIVSTHELCWTRK